MTPETLKPNEADRQYGNMLGVSSLTDINDDIANLLVDDMKKHIPPSYRRHVRFITKPAGWGAPDAIAWKYSPPA